MPGVYDKPAVFARANVEDVNKYAKLRAKLKAEKDYDGLWLCG